ncbi:MAG: ribulose-phosphate 3-epimerase [Cyclobacteriaceae bacterium]|nr:ribulose-phosphate 3-epimerase [Cyclobacteriaceae bacterium]
MSLIAPSILNSDFLTLGNTLQLLNESQADWVHMDVMDGSFVPNISFGIPIVEAARKVTKKPLDVHLMIVNPEKYIEGFRAAGADLISIHHEACIDKDFSRILKRIREIGARPALVINPDTPVEKIFEFVPLVDMVLVMSVFPGFGGQKFIESTFERVTALKSFIKANNLHTLIEVDGGVSKQNMKQLKECGVDVFVIGSVIFRADDPAETITELKSIVA